MLACFLNLRCSQRPGWEITRRYKHVKEDLGLVVFATLG